MLALLSPLHHVCCLSEEFVITILVPTYNVVINIMIIIIIIIIIIILSHLCRVLPRLAHPPQTETSYSLPVCNESVLLASLH